MTIHTIQSGSDGNCHFLKDSKGRLLILDCGIYFNKILKAVGYGIQSIEAVCVTHNHKDHSLAANRFRGVGCTVIDSEGSYACGDYRIKTFDLVHDVPCIGFYVRHPEMGSLVYLTDTEFCKYRFKGINHILVECNYDKSLLPHDHPALEHVLKGHMELETVKAFIKANRGKALRTVMLCHMSQSNLDYSKALAEITAVAGNNVKVKFAEGSDELLIP